MDEATARRLAALNHDFYERFGGPFARSRARPQPGWSRLLDGQPAGLSWLDIGCGDGRFGRFLAAARPVARYTGVDYAGGLLDLARSAGPTGDYLARDLLDATALEGLEPFERIVCLSTLQHIPGQANRSRLLAGLGRLLAEGAQLWLANWQFLDHEAGRRRVRPWSEAGIDPADVEPGDALLSWQRGGYGLRYVTLIDAAATAQLAAAAGLRVRDSFRSDGRPGDSNLYTRLSR
jgi:SAM-dependent methyltransferase